ncbi:gamma-mobile-trio protein GmtX [Pseudoalteromonas piscicida]|uniref:Alpha/beta hydrolase n=1 Tax=Pseudoalteromonas piscicida TaxID=43662 RepID=A0ABM6NN17_PSEO7|nr:gamma-mobile-trio protein GmtX [Pseudoalteromonas piscicida]ATD10235.1 hypothetical protein PPIS_b1229 [Pseudoalteromonas piscicida]WPU32076.1 gamma-mobile-trio protein GmtX [Pseudoalteromonas piscicida]
MTDIARLLTMLKEGKSIRTKKSLDTLNQILEGYSHSEQPNYSITNIGKLSQIKGGPSYETIRATRNKHYRELIDAWATNAPHNRPPKNAINHTSLPTDYELLEKLRDPALRVPFGQVLAERNRFRQELKILKSQANIVIDKRHKAFNDDNSIEHVLFSDEKSSELTQPEESALRYAISERCCEDNNWQFTRAGQVKELEFDTEIFPRGFVSGLAKLLSFVDQSK